MLKNLRSFLKRVAHQITRKAISWLPRQQRFKVFRSFADCNPSPSRRLLLKIAETREELEEGFSLLHDA